jgi:demethylmenaquinone methyltransferase/2-methoxy-6-polyprenyl-1,4-benzoquinol methylase
MPKAGLIRPMFDAISWKYDFLNDLLSLFIHRYWKKQMVKKVQTFGPSNILDCATGTGDIAFLMSNKTTSITAVDFSESMIQQAKIRLAKRPWPGSINFQCQDIEQLPFADKEFDVTTISFGIRNVEHLPKCLNELGRVTQKALVILEFGKPKNKIVSKLIFSFLKMFVPLVGSISNQKSAYQYLIESSERFPCGEDFIDLLKKNTNFSHFKYETFAGGLVYLYSASNNNHSTQTRTL